MNKNMYTYIMMYPLLMITNIIILKMNSYLSMWFILEINMIIFINIIITKMNMKKEMFISYFMIQVTNSMMFLITMFMLMFNINNKNIIYLLMMITLLNKMGMPPMFMWYINFFKKLNWMDIMLMSTIQKFIPMMIISKIFTTKNLNFMPMILYMLTFFTLIMTIMNINYSNLKIIMSISSIIQMSWMIMLMFINQMMMMNYFMIYSMITMSICLTFKFNNINFMNQLLNMQFLNKNMFFFIIMPMFSLSGLPPFFGFMMKWLSIQTMTMKNFQMFNMIIMIINSLISLYFYIRLMFNSLTNYHIIKKMNFKYINLYKKNLKNSIYLIWMTLTMLIIYELM